MNILRGAKEPRTLQNHRGVDGFLLTGGYLGFMV